jgi:hypothetical protein
LTPAGARKALDRLGEAGFAERVGSGRALKYRLVEDGVAIQALAQVFAQEQQRYDSFISALRGAVSLREVSAAWLEPLPVSPRQPVLVTVVVDSGAVVWIRDELRSRVIGLEKQFDLIIEIAVLTRADATEPGPDVQFLWGTDSTGDADGLHHVRTHDEAIERSLMMSQGIADLIRSDPSLIKRATQHVARLLHEGQGTANGDLVEWGQLLETYSPERMRDLLVSTSSRAERLRQSSPFFAVLTSSERDQLIAALEAKR